MKASGLRWLSLTLLVPIPWAGRVWALPFLTTLAPSERACREHGWWHRKLTDWARQLVLQTRRWLPGRDTAGRRLADLLTRKPVRLATVAMANKLARIVWAVLVRGEVYQRSHTPALAE